ncbi:MAG TPA: class II glutamine amidotransferase [Jatrophihabitans sp.]|nr:class II glutamine amidotransferase [Jatrophihabitans sp.]
MCRLVGWVSARPVTMRELLGDAAVDRLLTLSTVHCHGWGAAWWADGRLVVRRSAVQAGEDPGFLELVDSLAATSAIVHLRLGTPGFGRDVDDNHPFADGSWALAHNGAVAPSHRVDALLAPDSARAPRGTTDSERFFLALRDELDALAGADTPHEGVPHAVANVVERALGEGMHASSWNSLLLGPEALYVVNHHDRSWVPVDVQLWPDMYPEQAVCWPPYFDLRIRELDGACVVVSSGVVDDVRTTEGDRAPGWELLPNDSVLRLDFGTAAGRLERIPVSSQAPDGLRSSSGNRAAL